MLGGVGVEGVAYEVIEHLTGEGQKVDTNVVEDRSRKEF